MPPCDLFPSYPKQLQKEGVLIEVTEALMQREKSWGLVELRSKKYKVWVDQARWGFGGSRYQTGIPRVKLGRERVAMTGTVYTPGGGARNGI